MLLFGSHILSCIQKSFSVQLLRVSFFYLGDFFLCEEPLTHLHFVYGGSQYYLRKEQERPLQLSLCFWVSTARLYKGKSAFSLALRVLLSGAYLIFG